MTRQKNKTSDGKSGDAAVLPSAPTKSTSTATIKEVALAAGVSVGTVSNVFNNRLALVRADKRERVLQAARDLNFQPSAAARTLARGHTRTLGVLFYRRSGAIVVDPYASIILQGILNAAANANYGALLYPEHWRNKEQGAALFSDRSVDGVVVIAPRVEIIPELAQLGLPLALVSVRYEDANTAVALAVDVDNVAGGRIATQHLINLGHRKIAHLSGTLTQRSAHEREAGWRAALVDAQIELPSEYRIECDYQGATAYEATRQLFALPEPPTAIFAANDQIAFECLQAARDTGVSVPDQLSVIGFDDVLAATLVTPRLTTIRQPLVQIGSAAVDGLISHLQSDSAPAASEPPAPSKCLLFTPELIVRGSTAPPPSEPPAPRLLHQPNHPILQGVLK